MLTQIKRKLNLNVFFDPRISTKLERVTSKGIELLERDRRKLLSEDNVLSNRALIRITKGHFIQDILTPIGLRGINFFQLRAAGKTRIGDLNSRELQAIRSHFRDKSFLTLCIKAINFNYEGLEEDDPTMYPVADKLKPLKDMSSKQLRIARTTLDPICVFKIGLILDPKDSMSYMLKVNSLTSIRLKNNLLRALHNEVYTNARLFKFGLTESSLCDKCQQVDTLEHRLLNCNGYESIASYMIGLTNKLRPSVEQNEDRLNSFLMANSSNCLGSLTLHSEVLSLIISNKSIQGPPRETITRILKGLIAKEMNNKIKKQLSDLLLINED